MSALVFTLGCKNGHKIDTSEAEAMWLNGAACQTCQSTLYEVAVRREDWPAGAYLLIPPSNDSQGA